MEDRSHHSKINSLWPKLSIYVFFFSLVVAIVYIYRETLAIFFIVFSVVFSFIFIFLIAIFCWLVVEKMKVIKAERKKKETESNVMTVITDGQVFIREMDHKATWRAAHLDPRVYANGQDSYNGFDPDEVANWTYFNKPNQKVIEGRVSKNGLVDKVPSFYELVDQYPHLMLLGGTGSGKTTLLAEAMKRKELRVNNPYLIWLSTHGLADKKLIPAGCFVKSTVPAIASAIQGLFNTYQSRRDGLDYGFRPFIVVLDEWPEIIDELKDFGMDAGEYLRRLSRGGRKFNFYLILGSHGGTVKDLGLEGYSSVKQDFAQVYLSKHLTQQGKAVWQQFNNKASQVEISIPAPGAELLPYGNTPEEITINAWKNGMRDFGEITKMAYKGRGGNQERLVREIISKNF